MYDHNCIFLSGLFWNFFFKSAYSWIKLSLLFKCIFTYYFILVKDGTEFIYKNKDLYIYDLYIKIGMLIKSSLHCDHYRKMDFLGSALQVLPHSALLPDLQPPDGDKL